MSVLPFAETLFLSITALVADAMLKAADVELGGQKEYSFRSHQLFAARDNIPVEKTIG